MKTFSIKECISFGWQTFKSRPGLFLLVPVIAFAVGFGGGIVQGILTTVLGKTSGFAVSFLISMVVNTFLGMGIISLYLKAHDDAASTHIRDLWNPKPFWRFLGTNILVTLCVLVGLILFIVPGIIVSIMLSFAAYLVIDRGLNPIAALKESMRLTKGNRWNLFGLVLTVVVLNLVGILLLVVGVLVTVPISILASVHAYRALGKEPAAEPVQVEPSVVRSVG